MGFLLAGNALLVLFLMLLVLRKVYGDDWEGLYEVRGAAALVPTCCCGVCARGCARPAAAAGRACTRCGAIGVHVKGSDAPSECSRRLG